jgi:hypothetical protein
MILTKETIEAMISNMDDFNKLVDARIRLCEQARGNNTNYDTFIERNLNLKTITYCRKTWLGGDCYDFEDSSIPTECLWSDEAIEKIREKKRLSDEREKNRAERLARKAKRDAEKREREQYERLKEKFSNL